MSMIPQPSGEIVPRPWQTGIAPVYIGLFLWIGYFDQIGRKVLPLGGLAGAFLGLMIGGPLVYFCLFRCAAFWSHRSRQPLEVLATATFGVSGARFVPGLCLLFAQVFLFAVAVRYAVEFTLQGLTLGGLIDTRAITPGPAGWPISRSPLFLATALFWAIATALVSLKFIRWIAYLMQFFPIFPALMLGGAMMATLTGLQTFRPTVDSISNVNVHATTFLLTLQWIFAFSSMACVMGADWGLGSVSLVDLRKGGSIGTAFAPAVVGILSLIAVAGFEGSRQRSLSTEGNSIYRAAQPEIIPVGQSLSIGANGVTAPSYTFQALMINAFREQRLNALFLITFGLGSLAPAVYASFAFGNLFKRYGPGLSRLTWTMLGTFFAWFLIAGGWTSQPETFFNILGAVFAPAAGAFAADYRRSRGIWPGSRAGINPAGLLAWGAGLAVGLCPTISAATGSTQLSRVQPAAVLAFLTAYLVYEVLAMIGLESGKLTEKNETVS